MAVACTHSYSFVSIETLSPGQACIFELHKPLPVIRNTHRYGYSLLTGSLFLGVTFCNWRTFTNQVTSYHTCAIFSRFTVLIPRSPSYMLLRIMCKFSRTMRTELWPDSKSRRTVHDRCCVCNAACHMNVGVAEQMVFSNTIVHM